MAAKSDFAKKLLHDLRLRKERMAASQSSSNARTNTKGKYSDAYVNPGQTYQGSRQNKTLELVKQSNSQRRSNSSSQIVNYGRTQSSQQIGDLSMALLLALENGGKLSATDSKGNHSMLGFIKPRSSTNNFQTISHIHINDISRGVQNLNKILRACSNGVNLDSYSIQVGKELLKGAIDLEESLRMLVNLQEASEQMVPHQRTNRLTLLQEGEEDEDNIATSAKLAKDKQLVPPKFSFDKPSRNSHDLNQALATSNLWARLQNYKPEPKNDTAAPPPKHEKRRISNVIAKLMGLDEVPQKLDLQNGEKELIVKKKEGMNKTTEVKTHKTENLSPLASDKRVIKKPKSSPIMLKVEKSRVSSSVNLEENVSKKNYERGVKASVTTGVKRESATVNRKKNDSTQENQNLANRKKNQENERDKESTKQKEIRHKENGHQKVVREGTSSETANVLQKKNMKNPEGKSEQPIRKQFLHDKNLDETKPNLKGSQKKQPHMTARVRSKPLNDLPKALTNRQDEPTRKKSYRKADEVMAGRNSSNTNNLLKILKPKSKEELKQRQGEKVNGSKEVEKVNKSIEVNPLTCNKPNEVQGGGKRTSELDSVIQILDECHSPEREFTPNSSDRTSVPETNSEVCTVSKDHQETAHMPREGSEEPLHESWPIPISGVYEAAAKKVSTLSVQEPLTENEMHLKEILIKGQIFLNSAEALFKLNIPINILHNTSHTYQDSNAKLVLDCGYEVMNRKGRIQELLVDPFAKIQTCNIKLNSFDDLVKQLYKDFTWLKLWNRTDESEDAKYLQKMLERDIENKVPNLNCMWEFGWTNNMFVLEEKDGVVKYVEVQLLNELIDEITIDLLSFK